MQKLCRKEGGTQLAILQNTNHTIKVCFDGKLLPHNFVFCEVTIKITLYTLFVVAQVDVTCPGMLSSSSWLVKYSL